MSMANSALSTFDILSIHAGCERYVSVKFCYFTQVECTVHQKGLVQRNFTSIRSFKKVLVTSFILPVPFCSRTMQWQKLMLAIPLSILYLYCRSQSRNKSRNTNSAECSVLHCCNLICRNCSSWYQGLSCGGCSKLDLLALLNAFLISIFLLV